MNIGISIFTYLSFLPNCDSASRVFWHRLRGWRRSRLPWIFMRIRFRWDAPRNQNRNHFSWFSVVRRERKPRGKQDHNKHDKSHTHSSSKISLDGLSDQKLSSSSQQLSPRPILIPKSPTSETFFVPSPTSFGILFCSSPPLSNSSSPRDGCWKKFFCCSLITKRKARKEKFGCFELCSSPTLSKSPDIHWFSLDAWGAAETRSKDWWAINNS